MKLLHITVGFLLPVLSMAAVLQRDLVMPAPCVGIALKDLQAPGGAGELEYQGFGVSGIDGQDPHYDASSLDTYSPGDLCDREVNGETVNCTGDITVKCVGYGVANYNGLSCRTSKSFSQLTVSLP